jgi:peptide subunit release factor RF-3
MAWFRRKDTESLDPQYLLAQANAAKPAPPPAARPTAARPTRPTQPAAASPESRPVRTPVQRSATGFRMTVEDVFVITGRGLIATGRVAAGTVIKGSTVRLARTEGTTRDVQITGIEKFRQTVELASTGDDVGLLLRGVTRDDVGRGDVLST